MLFMRTQVCQVSLSFLLWSALLATSARGELASSSPWLVLPEETVGALRIPHGKNFLDALVANTRLGAVMFGEEKQAALAKVLETAGEQQWDSFQKQLEEFGLTREDLQHVLAGESGYAVVLDSGDGEEKTAIGLAWFEPGEAFASRALAMIAKAVELYEDEEYPIARVDMELAGTAVMQLRIPSIRMDYEQEFEQDDSDELSEKEQEAAWKKAYQEWQESAVAVVAYHTVLVSAAGDRLLLAHTFVGEATEESTGQADRLAATLERLMTATPEAGGFVSHLQNDPTVARTLGLEGVAACEMLVDVGALIKLAHVAGESDENLEKALRMIGADGLGPMALRSTLQATQWHTAYSLAVAAPRQGFLKLLDQEELPAEPPSWVPDSAVRYSHMSFDVAKFYAILKEEILREFPEQAAAGFQMVEAQVEAFVKTSLEEVLGSLGNRHTMISFGFEAGEGDDIERRTAERTAFVWQVRDEPLWGRVLEALKPYAGMAGGLEFTEEQGYRGWRMKSEKFEGGLILGNGNLVFAMGSEVMEATLSSLNHPPAESDSLRGGQVYATASEMLDLEPCLAMEIVDGRRYMKMVWGIFQELIEMEGLLDSGEGDSGQKMFVAILQSLLPSEEEITQMMGVIVSRLEVNDEGMFAGYAMDLPAP